MDIRKARLPPLRAEILSLSKYERREKEGLGRSVNCFNSPLTN